MLNPKGQLHDKAKRASRSLGEHRLVTTEMVLAEVLAFYAGLGTSLREVAARLIATLCDNPSIVVVPQTSFQFHEALALYQQRNDKEWSLADCASILAMQAAGISEALTHDEHFRQAGFTALPR